MCAKRRPVLAFIPVRLIALSFLAMILLGACLLTLPIAAKSGRVSFFDALFTATSAVCVTGLTVVETGLRFSLFGQVVLLLLIQMGGLGFVTFLTLGFIALGRRITIRDRLLIQEAMNESNIGGMVRLILWVTRMTFCCEGLGAALLCIRFVPEFGLGKGLWYGVFHAVSAFCNAGFDVLGEGVSIARYGKDPLVLLTLSFLMIAGGLGFGAVYDLISRSRTQAGAGRIPGWFSSPRGRCCFSEPFPCSWGNGITPAPWENCPGVKSCWRPFSSPSPSAPRASPP